MESQNNQLANNADVPDCSKEPYLVVDYGEQLVHHVDGARRELQAEIASLREKVRLVWEFVRVLGCFTTLTVLGLFVTAFSGQLMPQFLVPAISRIAFSCTVGFAFLNITPLHKALMDAMRHVQYEPRFTSCQCKHCGTSPPHEPVDACTSTDTETLVPSYAQPGMEDAQPGMEAVD